MTEYGDRLALRLERAEQGADYIRETARHMEQIVLEERETARLAKYEHALAVVRYENANTANKIPATVRKEHAFAEDTVQAALKKADEAAARRIGIDAKRESAEKDISLYQSMVKDRL